MGLNCLRLLNCTCAQNYTKPNLYEGTKLHEDDFAPRVNFARVTFLHKSKKIQKKKKKSYRPGLKVRGNIDSKKDYRKKR